MPHEIRVPRLGWSMEEGTFTSWLKQPGEMVSIGEPLYELEGEKATQAIESLDSGVLQLLPNGPAPGSVVAVGTLLGYLCAVGETIAFPADDRRTDPATQTVSASLPSSTAANAAISTDSQSHQRTEAPPSTIGPSALPSATPRARRAARQLGVDWSRLAGTGRGGRIREADVRLASEMLSTDGSSEVLTLSSRHRTSALRLRHSQEHTVPVTLTTSADATQLVAWRRRLQAELVSRAPTYTDLIAWQVRKVLRTHRQLAACWSDNAADLLLPSANGFHLGIAVETPQGLLVPVVRESDSPDLDSFAVRSLELIARARAGRLSAAEMQGGVFTISNLGGYGIDTFTPIINYPETAILGLGALRRVPWLAADDSVVACTRISLSLTFDHAAHDGAPAAAMLRDVAAAIERGADHSLG